MAPLLCSSEQVEWEKGCPYAMTSDVLWRLDAYRAAFYLLHVAREDVTVLSESRADGGVASQLLRASGSVSANIGEGYSRSTRAERLRFPGYALGSCRECVSWYQAARRVLADDVIDLRLALLTRIRALLLGLTRSIRDKPRLPGQFER